MPTCNQPVGLANTRMSTGDAQKSLRSLNRSTKDNTLIGKNWQIVLTEPIEIQDCKEITDHLRGIYRPYPNLIKENRRMSTWNQPVGLANTRMSTDYAQKSPDHWFLTNFHAYC